MHSISLLTTTGHPQIDDIIRGVIGVFEAAFPGRVGACYLAGSYADGSAVPLSDIDIRVVFKGGFQGKAEIERIRQVRDYCGLISPVAIDLPPLSEERLHHDEDWIHEAFGIRLAGVLLYGQDIRAGLPLPSFETYTHNVTTTPILFFPPLHRRPLPLTFPLEYPDADGVFYGYDEVDSSGQRSTKRLVHAVGFAASCILALRAGQMVLRKRDWLQLYKQHIADKWTTFLETLYTTCKQKWAYHIPDDQAAHQILRDLCREALAFENHYLTIYREYLLEHLRSDDPARQLFAIQRLKEVVYPDRDGVTG